MRRVLGRVFSARGASRGDRRAESFLAPLSVERPAYYIGDIHGAREALARLLEVLDSDPLREGRAELVFLGDYVDRGEDSRGTIELLAAIAAAAPQAVTVLAGNHERMMLDFLIDPLRHGRAWLANGGLQTLASFGIRGVTETSSAAQLTDAARALTEALGRERLDWLRRLPLLHVNGNLHAVHAGADPGLPMDRQPADTLLWGHGDFRHIVRDDGNWIIHGHTTYPHPQIADGRIAIDTGAWHSGILTAAFVRPGVPVRFLDSRGG